MVVLIIKIKTEVLVGEAHLQTSAMNNRDQIANNLARFTLNNRLYFDQSPQHKKANGQ
ncbi:hypothetical protein VCHA50P417_20319 [Vibrio chagasii]|nr:hypothetical protein VCHA32P90_170044 [Vibrio chagasii]CAH6977576.1 hypothetical protein VCHA35O142_40176 [Vibrio chagasii]CAH6982345.1 hypothetical protein VCHA39P230_170042 [Vibrio chagasii]CAH7042922.1 hypothetical protein VCHA54P489_10065 [Vibrio chagasii]CAH7164569.1 hypothetical protein VCHA50P417_20319 [Vibrio chagasii]